MKNVTDLNSYGKLKQIKSEFDELLGFVKQSAEKGSAIHEVELALKNKLLSIGKSAIDYFIIHQGDGDLGETIELNDKRIVKRLPSMQGRPYRSIFGEHAIIRYVYGSRKG